MFKGERIVVPRGLRRFIIDKIHASHLGRIQGCLQRAKEDFYWPGIYKLFTMTEAKVLHPLKIEDVVWSFFCQVSLNGVRLKWRIR